MIYLSLAYFLVAWWLASFNVIKRIDMRIEARERGRIEKERGEHTVGLKTTKEVKRTKIVKLPKWLCFFVPRYDYQADPFIYDILKEYKGMRRAQEYYLSTLMLSLWTYFIGLVLFCFGIIINDFDIPFLMLIIIEGAILFPVELYYAKKK